MRPIEPVAPGAPPLVNHSAPSGPVTMWCGYVIVPTVHDGLVQLYRVIAPAEAATGGIGNANAKTVAAGTSTQRARLQDPRRPLRVARRTRKRTPLWRPYERIGPIRPVIAKGIRSQ